jgi:hypothetical protein
MNAERVKCNECDSMILPATAARYGGLCATCGRMSAQSRCERAEYYRRLATGEVYRPRPEELAAARPSRTLAAPDADWTLEPDFYADHGVDGVPDAIRLAEREPRGNVFLVNDAGARLNLSFTETHAVCTFREADETEFYARTPDCLDAQVPREQHVVSACPCCGVGTGWFPSRFHLPRSTGFAVLRAMTRHESADEIWLPAGDYTSTIAGTG